MRNGLPPPPSATRKHTVSRWVTAKPPALSCCGRLSRLLRAQLPRPSDASLSHRHRAFLVATLSQKCDLSLQRRDAFRVTSVSRRMGGTAALLTSHRHG